MNEPNKELNIRMEVEKGEAALRQAKILSEQKEYDGAISRGYYAVFHIARAVILTHGLEAKTHEGVVRLFNLHFIKSGKFPKKYSTILSHSQKAREESDYSPEIPFTEEDAGVRLGEAGEFVRVMKEFLSGYLKD